MLFILFVALLITAHETGIEIIAPKFGIIFSKEGASRYLMRMPVFVGSHDSTQPAKEGNANQESCLGRKKIQAYGV